uniref:Uncharacterized protein n=1 Tax=viral metagenome TaxID=1070528 RepID=A0A6M3KYE8_9ZZZZ
MTDKQKMVEVLVSDVLTVPIHEIKFNVPKWLKDEKELCFMYAKKKDKPLTEQVELYWMRTSDTEEIESKKKFLSFIYGEENVKTYKYTKPRSMYF